MSEREKESGEEGGRLTKQKTDANVHNRENRKGHERRNEREHKKEEY